MRTEPVDIYSEAGNAAVLRHPGRRFPGCLLQGDTLDGLVRALERVQQEQAQLSSDAADELNDVTEHLKGLRQHYMNVLKAHGMDLPFNEPG